MSGLGGGCEPYTVDFGDREYGAWLERWLRPAEMAERRRLFDRWWALDARVPGWVPWRLRGVIGWRRRRAYRRFDRLAESRGGPAPAPSVAWKFRTDWGV